MKYETEIPFLDLVSPHRELEEQLVAVLRSALQIAGFVGGPMLNRFEREFAEFCGVSHCVGLGSGTDAVRFALMAAGVGAGDVVVTVPNTFIATTEAITQAGAIPEFVDIDETTYNLDPEKLREYLERQCSRDEAGHFVSGRSGARVRAIVPVHLYGQTADMDAILELAESFGLMVIEDACQAHGARYFSRKENRWLTAGSMGKAAAFSFYPGKNLGACGEAGAVTTNDPEVAARVRMVRDHGQAKKYYHDIEGYNGRLDAIQAGFLEVKLQYLCRSNLQRRQIAEKYARFLAAAENPVAPPFEPWWCKGVYHLYVVRTREREKLIAFLKEEGIGTGIHYPVPLHLQKAYRHLGYKHGDFPVAEKVSGEIASLPMFPTLTAAQQERIVQALTTFAEMETAPVVA
jgi:dTDP-4-amino-4,6-dideoxygalactose transaminase